MVRRKISKFKSKKAFARSFSKNSKRRSAQRKKRAMFRGGYRL
jgi:hypothetical protein